MILFTLFSSISNPETRSYISIELDRVLKPDGEIMYYDFRYNNSENQNVVGIDNNEINNLFCMNKILKLITMSPPLSRKLGKMTPILYPVLSTTLLFLCSHYNCLFVNRAT